MDKARVHYAELEYSSACDIILSIASAGNLYMNDKAPWSLFKQGGSAAEGAAQVSLLVSLWWLMTDVFSHNSTVK